MPRKKQRLVCKGKKSLYPFPKETRFEIWWTQYVETYFPHVKICKTSRLCYQHFKQKDFIFCHCKLSKERYQTYEIFNSQAENYIETSQKQPSPPPSPTKSSCEPTRVSIKKKHHYQSPQSRYLFENFCFYVRSKGGFRDSP